jgi:hypothetical protein
VRHIDQRRDIGGKLAADGIGKRNLFNGQR